MALKGFLSDNANPEQVEKFLRGLEKIEASKARHANFKAEYISKNGDTRGMTKAWKDAQKAFANREKEETIKVDEVTEEITLPSGVTFRKIK